METAAVAKLKASLSEYLARVKAGEEVIVTDRGKPIAKIVPLARETAIFSPQFLALEKAGLATVGAGTLPDDFWRMPRPHAPKNAALQALLAEREEGR